MASSGADHGEDRAERAFGSASGRPLESGPAADETSRACSQSGAPQRPLTRLIQLSADGDPGASEELWRAVYQQLRMIALHQLRHESDHPCQPTTLVHEAYLRLIGSQRLDFRNRRHFFGAAARAMRQILVEESRRRRTLKRGGGRKPLSYQDPSAAIGCERDARTPSSQLDMLDLIALSEALDRLEAHSPRLAEIVHLRFFGGLTIAETAELLGLSERTVASDWAFARAWLSRELATRTGTRA